jgi:prefoldin subunit 5
MTREQELGFLRNEAQAIRSNLEEIERRIQEIEQTEE